MGDVVVAPRVRWYRKRPPAGMPPFARRVWWAGHGQLFVGAALAVLGPLLFGLGVAVPTGATAGTGVLLFAMAAPFACSGLMLRRYGIQLAGDSNGLFFRVVELALVVLGIAVLSIAFVWVDMLLLILVPYAWMLGTG